MKHDNGQMDVGLSKIQQTFSEDLHIDIQNLTSLTADEACKILESKGFDSTQMTRLNTYLENQSRTINFSFHADAADGISDDIGKDIIDK